MKKTWFIILSVINFIAELSKVLKDKRISFFEGVGLMPEVRDLARSVQSLPEAKKELEQIDDAESVATLMTLLISKFPKIDLEAGEELLSVILTWVESTSRLINKIKELNIK